jgi:hypothetical protein
MAHFGATLPLVAFAQAFAQIVMDNALDLLDVVMTAIVHDAQHHGEKTPIRTLRDLDAGAQVVALPRPPDDE